MTYREIDQKALQIAKDFRKAEADLLDIIIQVDRNKVFRKYGYNSLYQYIYQRLKLSESQTYAFMSVARKSHAVPKLQESIRKGDLSLNKAKRITSVINKDNQDHWLQIASSQTQKMLEREVALAQPEKAIQERSTYIPGNTTLLEKVQIKKSTLKIKLEMGLTEKTMLKLRRVQDLVSQKRRESVNLETTIEALVDDFIKREDPFEKAKRQKVRGKLKVEPNLKDSKENEINKKSAKQKNPSHPSKPFLKSQSPKPFSRSQSQKPSSSGQSPKPFSRSQSQKPFSSGQSPKSFSRSQSQKPFSRKGRSGQRKSLPAMIKHQVILRDQGQCTSVTPEGRRCASRRFLEVHHILPISKGGLDNLENLTLLCSGHHAVLHQ